MTLTGCLQRGQLVEVALVLCLRLQFPAEGIEHPAPEAPIPLRERIERAHAVPAIADQPARPQMAEVTRDARLRLPEQALDVADAQRAAGEQIDDAQAGAVGEGAKERGC